MTEHDPSRPKPEEMTPEHDPYPLPSTPQIIPVTPEMASSWLSFRGTHPKLRPLSPGVAAKYQHMMESGRTKPGPKLFRESTPEGYIFDEQGYIISAQHRLKAQANAGVTLSMWIFPNQSRDIAQYLDQGYRRNAAHVIRVPHARDMGTGARHLAALADGDRWGMPRFNRVLVPETVETFRQWPELNWYPSEVAAIWRATSIHAGAHLAVLAQAARTEHREKIPDWLEGLLTGAELEPGDARLRLSRRFANGLVTTSEVPKRDYVYALIVKAWNAYARGEKISALALTLKKNEALPTVEGFSFEKIEKGAA